MSKIENDIIIYEDKDGITRVNVKFANAEIYKTTRQNIEQHISNIYADKELDLDSTCKKYLQVQKEGNREVMLEQLILKGIINNEVLFWTN